MITSEFAPLLVQYRAALEAQITLLHHLLELAARGRSQAHDVSRPSDLHDVIDERERLMGTLVSLESQIQPIRNRIAGARNQLSHLAEFREIVELHRQAVALVEEVVHTDDQSRVALRDAELARRATAESLEKGESTIAAYRRVVMPSVSGAALVNRKG